MHPQVLSLPAVRQVLSLELTKVRLFSDKK
jgi:hypothetical protein